MYEGTRGPVMEQPKQAVKWEKVYVFISSTFSDMHAERDYLVKNVFPELQDWCEWRKLRLVDIDLRWGVTEQDATHNRNAVKVCLERIDDCRPFFLCFMGQRRGWVPHAAEISAETYDRFPELRSYTGNESITELEIRHALIKPLHRGVRYDPKKPEEKYEKVKHAFFYLRDDSYLAGMPAEPPLLRETYTNEGIEDPVEREGHDKELNKWRATIEHRGRPCHHYTAEWNEHATTPEIMLPLSSPSTDPQNIDRWRKQWAKAGIEVTGEDIATDPTLREKAAKFNELLSKGRLTDFASAGNELKDVILEDLKTAIAVRYPDHLENVEESELQKELDQQEEFLYINSEGFIEREGDFAELNRYLADDPQKLFVLTAPGGMGKTMLLANWIDRWKDRPEAAHTLHFRFVGQSDRSTTLPNLLRFLMLELQQIALKIPATKMETVKDPSGNDITREVSFEIPQDPIKIENLWKEQLVAIGKHGKTVIVIDAVNQLDTGLKDLFWLPLYGLPENIKFIISFREDADGAKELLESFEVNKEHFHLARVKPFENLANILNVVKGSDHIFIMAGLGGGTGTVAASIVGQACKELGILTVAVVTFPSHAEGESRTERAEEELSALLQVVDTVVIIPIDSVISDVQSKTHLDAAERANYLMREVVRTFLDIILRPPIGPRIDFADLRSATRERGLAIMGTGIANGENRGEIAAKQAISCFYSNNIPLNSARCVLITVATDQNASLHELEEIITIFQEELSDESDVFVGMCLNPSLEDAFRVTCIGSDIAMIDRRWQSLAAPSTRDACSNWESEDTGNFKKPVFTGLGRIFQRQSRRAAITPRPKKSTFLSRLADLASDE
jgi:cell division protein FtsZ